MHTQPNVICVIEVICYVFLVIGATLPQLESYRRGVNLLMGAFSRHAQDGTAHSTRRHASFFPLPTPQCSLPSDQPALRRGGEGRGEEEGEEGAFLIYIFKWKEPKWLHHAKGGGGGGESNTTHQKEQ